MENIYYSSMSAITELIFTHPIDYYKILKQNNTHDIKNIIRKNPYKGISIKLIGILPMRISFWSSLDYLKNHNYSPIIIPLITSTIQTIFDIPAEQLKINLIKNKKLNSIPPGLLKGALFHYKRNIFFTYGFYYGKTLSDNYISNNYFIAGILGGMIGSIISHPFDCLKTFYQSGSTKLIINKQFIFNGIIPRTSISIISMSTGYTSFMFFKNLFS